MSRYGLEPTPDFWRARFGRRPQIAVGIDPTEPPGSGKDVAGLGGVSTDDVLQYARFVDAAVQKMDAAFHHWESDPPGCGDRRCILVLAQWNQEMGALGPWQLWRERWLAFEQNLETSWWARVSAWDEVVSQHKELIAFATRARELGLPDVPNVGDLPTTYVEDAINKGKPSLEHAEKLFDRALIGAGIVGAVLIARELRR